MGLQIGGNSEFHRDVLALEPNKHLSFKRAGPQILLRMGNFATQGRKRLSAPAIQGRELLK